MSGKSDWPALPNAQQVRNVILSDDKVRDFVAAAYRADDKFGLLTDTLAVTGARPSQAVRLRVEDLRDHPVRPKLMMPKSAKGGDRNRAEKKLERYSVPITVQLAARLREAAKGRADDAPLFLQGDGSPWGDNPGAGYHREVKQIVSAIGADPDATMYALRHSSIVRMLKANVPIRLVASLHNTSTKMIEKHYSKYITEHSDDISRHALLHHEPPAGDNVVASGAVEKIGGCDDVADHPCTYSLKLAYIDFYFTWVNCTPHDRTCRKPMARREITGKKSSGANPREPQPVPTLAMSIPQFCDRTRTSARASTTS